MRPGHKSNHMREHWPCLSKEFLDTCLELFKRKVIGEIEIMGNCIGCKMELDWLNT